MVASAVLTLSITSTTGPLTSGATEMFDFAFAHVCCCFTQATGVTTVMIYASHLIFKVRKWTPPLVRQPFSVRVMIPCYKEDIETLEETVECAVEAAKAAMAKGQINAGERMTLQSGWCKRCV